MVGLKEMVQIDKKRAPPAWLLTLLDTTFYDACPEHPANEGRASRRTTECRFFCTQCADRALCSGCLGNHEGHEVIQIRKLSGLNVVRVEDVQHLLNVSMVQTNVYKGGYAVFLNRRAAVHENRVAPCCEECGWGLLDGAYRFCSFECKAEGIEDKLDFKVSFAVDPNNDISTPEKNDSAGYKTEPDDHQSPSDDGDEDSYSPSDEFQI